MAIKVNLGINIENKKDVTYDMDYLQHILIAGVTGSGKSVLGNRAITSIMQNHTPDEVQFLMFDTKGVELGFYKDSPYLIQNPIVDLDESVHVLKEVVAEIDYRLNVLNDMNEKYNISIKDLSDYNDRVNKGVIEGEPLPSIVIYVDELYPLVCANKEEVEPIIKTLGIKGRMCGVHLILSTQTPRREVVTGLIKSNIPTKISMMVSNKTESLIVIGEEGAEKLRPHGHFLMNTQAYSPLALQGFSPYISPDEAKAIAMQNDDELEDKQIENRVSAKIKEVISAIFDEEMTIATSNRHTLSQQGIDEAIEKARFDKGLK